MELSSLLDKVSTKVAARYRRDIASIMQYRKLGHELREQVKADPIRHGYLLTREMHPAELAVIEELYPDIKSPDPKERQRAWYWVLRQPWGKDFRASPYEQRYFHVPGDTESKAPHAG